MIHDPSVIIIDDSNYAAFVHETDDNGQSATGYINRPEGWVSGVEAAFPTNLLVPRDQWATKLAERKEVGLVFDMCKRATLEGPYRWLNQNPTNYCWCYAVVHAIMILRLLAKEPYKRLAPASVAAIIKDFKNVGGWGSQALDFSVQNGVADESAWPQPTAMLAITGGRQFVDSSRANAAQNKVTAFYRINTFDEKMSALFNYMPVACGYGWMGHEMCSIDPTVDDNGVWGSIDMDSYATKDGLFNARAIMGEKRCTGDDMVVPVALLAA